MHDYGTKIKRQSDHETKKTDKVTRELKNKQTK